MKDVAVALQPQQELQVLLADLEAYAEGGAGAAAGGEGAAGEADVEASLQLEATQMLAQLDEMAALCESLSAKV